MKVSLVVASGAHQGRVIPVAVPEFLIGRDPGCHLRPASQAISKQHCGVLIRNGRVFVKDYGSTNGTTVNGALIQSAEVAVEDGATLTCGPLDFVLKVEVPAPKPDGTPLPGSKEMAPLSAVKAAGSKPGTPRDATPNPAATKPAGSKPGVAAPMTEEDRIAAMILDMEGNDDSAASVPEGSTVMDIPSPLADGTPKKDEKGDDKAKKAQSREEMSGAANDLLRKYMRRPK